MELNQLKSLINQGESQTLEFKTAKAQFKAAFETICGFLNTDGGTVLIGVSDTQNITGLEVSDKTKQELSREVAKISPQPQIEIDYISIKDNIFVICIHAITDCTKRPYTYDGRAFIRVESSTHKMTHEQFTCFSIDNSGSDKSWETGTSTNATIDDLETTKILETITKGIENGRIPTSAKTSDPIAALKRLELIKNNKITNGAIVLFGKNPFGLFPQCLLRLARFRGVDRQEFIDNKQVKGNIFDQLEAAMAFANNYLPIRSYFPKNSIERVDEPIVPIYALREAIANALCHRDYSFYSGSVSFAIFDDRIEIWNYGGLPQNMNIEEIKEQHCSMPRNKRIANALYYHKILESWGRGIELIENLCIKSTGKKPYYKSANNTTLLTIYFKNPIGTVTNNEDVATEKSSQNELTSRHKEIVYILKEYGALSTNEIMEKLTDSPKERRLRDELNFLASLDLIESEGATTAKKWKIK